MENLHGLHVIITRPIAQAEPWARQLKELGVVPHLIPLLDIVPVRQPELIQSIKNCILNFDLYNKAIFVSQNAVKHGFEWIENYWPQLPLGIDFFAVGDTTAKQLHAMGVVVTDLAQTQTGAMTSETLLQSAALQDVAGNKIIIFRGLGGRSHLGDELTARGAQIHYCELYERQLPQQSFQDFSDLFECSEYVKKGDDYVIALHSGEALQNLYSVITKFDDGQLKRHIFNNCMLLLPSARILEQAHAAGFKRTFAAQNATDASMLQGLMDLKRTLKKV